MIHYNVQKEKGSVFVEKKISGNIYSYNDKKMTNSKVIRWIIEKSQQSLDIRNEVNHQNRFAKTARL